MRPLTAHDTDKITRINSAESRINLKYRVKSGNKHAVSQSDWVIRWSDQVKRVKNSLCVNVLPNQCRFITAGSKLH